MATRGGAVATHLARAAAQVETVPVLLVATGGEQVVGWCGARPGSFAELPADEADRRSWCVVGLTVDPVWRRQRIGARLLDGVVAGVRGLEPDAWVRSVVNARNRASLRLHVGCGFREEARGPTFAGITFAGGVGVLLRCAPGHCDRT